MTADIITVESLEDLAALLAESVHTVRLLRLQAESGCISPSEAAEEVRAVMEQINNHATPCKTH